MSNYSIILNKSLLDTTTLNNSSILSAGYLNNVLQDVESQIEQTEEYKLLGEEFTRYMAVIAREHENNLLKNVPFERKQVLIREASRNFDNDGSTAEGFKSKIRKIVNWRLDQIKREQKDHRWNVASKLFTNFYKKIKDDRYPELDK